MATSLCLIQTFHSTSTQATFIRPMSDVPTVNTPTHPPALLRNNPANTQLCCAPPHAPPHTHHTHATCTYIPLINTHTSIHHIHTSRTYTYHMHIHSTHHIHTHAHTTHTHHIHTPHTPHAHHTTYTHTPHRPHARTHTCPHIIHHTHTHHTQATRTYTCPHTTHTKYKPRTQATCTLQTHHSTYTTRAFTHVLSLALSIAVPLPTSGEHVTPPGQSQSSIFLCTVIGPGWACDPAEPTPPHPQILP